MSIHFRNNDNSIKKEYIRALCELFRDSNLVFYQQIQYIETVSGSIFDPRLTRDIYYQFKSIVDEATFRLSSRIIFPHTDTWFDPRSHERKKIAIIFTKKYIQKKFGIDKDALDNAALYIGLDVC